MSGADEKAIEEPRRPEIDLAAYMPLFEDESIGDAEKLALLEVLWSLVISFAQLGWGVHPEQQARIGCGDFEVDCGKLADTVQSNADETRSVIESSLPRLMGKFTTADQGSQKASGA